MAEVQAMPIAGGITTAQQLRHWEDRKRDAWNEMIAALGLLAAAEEQHLADAPAYRANVNDFQQRWQRASYEVARLKVQARTEEASRQSKPKQKR